MPIDAKMHAGVQTSSWPALCSGLDTLCASMASLQSQLVLSYNMEDTVQPA